MKRRWSPLSPQLQSYKFWSGYWNGGTYYYEDRHCGYENGEFFDLSPLTSSRRSEKNIDPYMTINCVNQHYRLHHNFPDLSKETKLFFHFKHPVTSACNLPSNCGFILKTVPSESALWRVKLCTEEEDYRDQMIHFHEEVRVDKMHLCLIVRAQAKNDHSEYSTLIPLSWLGWISSKEQREKWEKDYHLGCHNVRKYIVLYDTTA